MDITEEKQIECTDIIHKVQWNVSCINGLCQWISTLILTMAVMKVLRCLLGQNPTTQCLPVFCQGISIAKRMSGVRRTVLVLGILGLRTGNSETIKGRKTIKGRDWTRLDNNLYFSIVKIQHISQKGKNICTISIWANYSNLTVFDVQNGIPINH